VNPPLKEPLLPVFVIARTVTPLGLLYLAANLEKNHFSVKILDMAVEANSHQKLKTILKTHQPRFVGITANTPAIYTAYHILSQVKQNCQTTTVIGGAHVTFLPKLTLTECKDIDVVVIGEGERTIVELAKGLPLKNIRGIAYRKNQTEINVNKPRPLIENLDDLSFPARHLVDNEKYFIPTYGNITMVYTSRGCPFSCRFCVSSLKDGKKWRARSAENVISELDEIRRNFPLIKTIFFMDDNFLLNRKRVEKICEEIIERGFDRHFQWFCEARVDEIDEEIVGLMRRAGCSLIYLGVESVHQEVLNNVGKNTTIRQITSAVKTIEKNNIEIMASYILGTLGETRTDVEQTIEFAKKLNTLFVQFGVITPYPGSPFYDRIKRERKFLTGRWNEFSTTRHVFSNTISLSESDILKFYASYWLRLSFFKKNWRSRLPFLAVAPYSLIHSYFSYKNWQKELSKKS
jgi:anaerobic magnesium-protoporphyrin IX monomethyl ester cyclase